MKERSLTRGAGILLAISSLPSHYGIGTMGEAAVKFVDLLADLKQRYWQVLPIGPTGFGDSPYQPVSSCAGNPYLIDLDELCSIGLLKAEEIRAMDWGDNESDIDYSKMYENRYAILRVAFKRFDADNGDYRAFLAENSSWLDDYALFRALHKSNKETTWTEWEQGLKDRDPAAVSKYREKNSEEIDFYKFCQFQFDRQWTALKNYANQRGIQIIGDIPMYMAHDSADVWAHRDLFVLGKNGELKSVSAVPPDEFSEKGQIWGNPVYNWTSQEADDYSWWKERIRRASKLFDVIRLDHFIGMVKYYAVNPSSSSSAMGKWHKGPGKKLVEAIDSVCGDAKLIVDDAGPRTIVPGVKKLVEKFGCPCTRILLMAFNTGTDNDNLPHNYQNSNLIVYPSTHDNETLVGFAESRDESKLSYLYEYLNIEDKKDIPDAMIRLAYGSCADVVIVQMQDILGLGNDARMNAPSTIGGNWQWRVGHESLDSERSAWIRQLANIYRR